MTSGVWEERENQQNVKYGTFFQRVTQGFTRILIYILAIFTHILIQFLKDVTCFQGDAVVMSQHQKS